MALAYQQMAAVAGAGVQGMAVQFPAPAPGTVPAVSGHVPSRTLLAGRPSYMQQFPAKVQSNFYRAASFHKGTQPTTPMTFAYPAKFGTMGATAGPAVRQTMPASKGRYYPLDPARIQQLPSPAHKAAEKPAEVAIRVGEKQVASGVEKKLPQVEDVKPTEEDVESWRWILTISKPEEQVLKPNEDAEEDSQWIVSLARPAGCKALPVTAH
ncbi:unnamed protein product [Symbiodinium sp. CCMP2592]|nr:unnamed protein product [Symbiodinium sp. CCMP2592]